MNRNGKLSIVFASLVMPLTFLLSFAVSVHLKGTNPNQVDVTAGLAYLRPILITAIVSVIGCIVLSIIFAIRSINIDKDKSLGKFALILLAGLFILFVIDTKLINKNTDIIDDAYKTKLEQR